MLINYSDYNRSEELFTLKNNSVNIWEELYFCLKNMPLYLKQSDQKGKQGEAIFDPVGTNEHIKRKLESTEGWQPNFPIPDRYRHLGTDIDFIKKGILVEVQFSNYPFLTNNLLRSELFFKSNYLPFEEKVEGLIIVTKAGDYPSSNSTLYYEQAKKLIDSLCAENVFSIPIRLVCLDIEYNKQDIFWTKYCAKRYSRDVSERGLKSCLIVKNKNKKATIKLN